MASASTKVAQFPQHLPSFVHQFPKLCLDVGSTSFVLRTAQTVVFSTLAHVFFLGSRRIEFHVADVDLFLNADEVGLSACVPFSARVDLLAEHPQAPFFVFALLSNGAQTFTAFSKVRFQFCLL